MTQVNASTGICFFGIDQSIELKDFLSGLKIPELALQATEILVEEWLQTGCVYIDGRRQRENICLQAGQVLRLHTRRKRFPAAQRAAWRDRIICLEKDFLVFNKPSGLPTHATLDNFVENAKFLLESELEEPLFTTHRLDVPTAGLLILARQKEAQVRINREFARGRVKKIYQAWTLRPIAPGLYTHYIDPKTRVPRTISSDPQAGWWECRLQVSASIPQSPFHRHEVHLLTGKTHQIRAQFAAMDAPLVGDSAYGGAAHDGFGLICQELAFRFNQKDWHFRLADCEFK